MNEYEELKRMFTYNPNTGDFVRNYGVKGNRGQKGEVAGGLTQQGYMHIRFMGKRHKAHRLAWLYMTGEWPKKDLDHVDGDNSNNRWTNLREATPAQNLANSRPWRVSQAGFRGVEKMAWGNLWRARITIKGKVINLGSFPTPEDAAKAYSEAQRSYYGDFLKE